EEDTERAGDFLEGLLDALDVDGDITTWVDEVGGHIDLAGTDLDVLIGSNGETLDALQELTTLAVLRPWKGRARLPMQIHRFRAPARRALVAHNRLRGPPARAAPLHRPSNGRASDPHPRGP